MSSLMIAQGRVCYFCSSLDPPQKGLHRLLECPKRMREQRRDFSEIVHSELTLILGDRKTELERAIKEASEDTVEVKTDHYGDQLLEFNGAIKVLDRNDLMIWPATAATAPSSIREEHWLKLERRHQHLSEHFLMTTVRRLGERLPVGAAQSCDDVAHHSECAGRCHDVEVTGESVDLGPMSRASSPACRHRADARPAPEHWILVCDHVKKVEAEAKARQAVLSGSGKKHPSLKKLADEPPRRRPPISAEATPQVERVGLRGRQL